MNEKLANLALHNELTSHSRSDAIPQGVRHLGRLVANQNATLAEISAFISRDKKLSARLLKLANPTSEAERNYSITRVDQALERIGVGCALVMAMSDPLSSAVMKTFETTFAIKLEAVELPRGMALHVPHLLATTRFEGQSFGQIQLRMSVESAHTLAARSIGVPLHKVQSEAAVINSISKVIDAVVGNFQSSLSEAGLKCALSKPELRFTESFQLLCAPGGGCERLLLSSPELIVFIDNSVNPRNG